MHVRKLEPGELEWESLALGHVQAELEEFVEISMTLARSFGFLDSRVKSEFPKPCRKCGKTYESFAQFYYETEEIESGTVNYPSIGAEFYLHRNCRGECGSTLVVVFNDRRDDSELGNQRRLVFQKSLDILSDKMGLSESDARTVLFSLLRERIEQ